MITPSTKLALLVFVIPICSLIAVDVVGYVFFNTLLIDIIALFTSNWVFLLVWERLRESLSKKMEYLHDNFIYDIFDYLHNYDDKKVNYYFADLNVFRNNLEDIKRYSRFIVMNLFPKKLLSEIDDFTSNQETLHRNYEMIKSLSINDIGEGNFDDNTFLHCLGFDVYGIDNHKVPIYNEVANKMKNEQSALIVSMQTTLLDLKKLRPKIVNDLKDFLKANNLILKKELYSTPPHY